jgi:LacI family transcriptional regulator
MRNEQRGMVTIKDVARVVGVSSSTVARALNDSPLIGEATKIKVREAAQQLGYVVHSAARLMRGEASTVIGLTVPDVENEFYATLARAVAEVCREGGFQMVLSITEDDPAIEYEHLHALVGAQAAGAVIVPTESPLPDSLTLLQLLPSAQLIRHLPSLNSGWFAIDDERGIRSATEHLIELGHDRIAYIGATSALSTGQDRVKGFRSALDEAGIAHRPELIALGLPRASFARQIFGELYAKHQPTALVSGGSQITVGVLQAIAEHGISVPRQLSFVAYSDSALYESWQPALTAIALPIREIALAGSAALIRRIRESARSTETPTEVQHALYLPRLKIRQSTAAPPRQKLSTSARR